MIEGDARDEGTLIRALNGCDGVVSSLGTGLSPFRKVSLLTVATGALVTAMTRNSGVVTDDRLVYFDHNKNRGSGLSGTSSRDKSWMTIIRSDRRVGTDADKALTRAHPAPLTHLGFTPANICTSSATIRLAISSGVREATSKFRSRRS